MNTIESSLAQIELADPSLESHDGPERILAAVLDMCGADPVAAEIALVGKAMDPACEKRLNHVRALMHYMGFSGDISESTVISLIHIANNQSDISLSDAATLAIAWNRFENASAEAFDNVYRFLRNTADRPPPGLTNFTIQLVRAAFVDIEERKAALAALDSGQLVIPEDVVRNILSRRGSRSFNSLGYHQHNSDRLVRLLAWTSVLVGKTGRRRKARNHGVSEVGTVVLGPRGLPHATIKITWNHERLNNNIILIDSIVDG